MRVLWFVVVGCVCVFVCVVCDCSIACVISCLVARLCVCGCVVGVGWFGVFVCGSLCRVLVCFVVLVYGMVCSGLL